MSDPDTIRANIEATRADLSGNVDALADKVSPSSIADRQKEKVKDRVRSARESVMGATRSVTDSLPDGGTAGSAVETAKGHPLVVGLIAFGAGWLLSSLLPTADAERGLASTAKEKAAPLVDAAKGAAKDAAQQLKDPAKDAAAHLKETATDAAGTVKDEGRSAASDVRDQASDAKDGVSGAARGDAS
jgi:gas vesicle protein